MRFDRIQVSNILDDNYVGIEGVLNKWAPLLKNSRTAAIVGYFMNWIAMQKGAQVSSAGPEVMAKVVDRLIKEGKVSEVSHIFRLKHRPSIYLVSAEEFDEEW